MTLDGSRREEKVCRMPVRVPRRVGYDVNTHKPVPGLFDRQEVSERRLLGREHRKRTIAELWREGTIMLSNGRWAINEPY